MSNNDTDTFSELRGHFDAEEGFMTQGHQIIKTRRMVRKVPIWAKNNKKIQQLLLKSFPKLKTDPKQRVAAARWVVIIQLYFKMQMTQGQVAAQAKLPLNVTRMLIRTIKRASEGKTTNYRVRKYGTRGRPKK